MSKIQGKQIADQTITQSNLNLATPDSGDTSAAATVGFVTDYITTLSGDTVIGPAEDGSYTDGIFTDFTPETRIGVAIDRFNEMFLLLAPTPPSTNWTSAFNSPAPTLTSATLSPNPRIIGTGNITSNVVTTQTPTFTLSSNVGIGAAARTKEGNFTFTLKDWDGSTIETTTITTSSTSKVSGTLRYTIADPYAGNQGQEGFWVGVTSFNTLASAIVASSITPGVTARQLSFEHPDSQTKNSVTFYVDNATHTPSVANLNTGTLTQPTMTSYLSGVPRLTTGQQFTGIDFDILNVSSYFYRNGNVWTITGNATNTGGAVETIPTTVNETANFTNKTATVVAGYSESISFTVNSFNRIGTAGGTQVFTNNNLRRDSSTENRLTSGLGTYPSTGWGGTYDSSVSIVTGTYVNELQLLNGVYRYPTVNYTSYGGPDYSSATGTRYVTFNIGSFSNNSAFTLGITGTNITSIGQSDLRIEVQISGQTFWVDGNASYSGGNPGSSTDGDAAVVFASSTPTSRRITFGTPTYTGAIIVRIGMTAGSNITITSLTATSLV